MEKSEVCNILEFVDSVICAKSGQWLDMAKRVIGLAAEVRHFIEQNRYLIPYHLNLIDELHINENAHSRILYKLLQYRDSCGHFIFLESMLKYIAKDCKEFGKICIKAPEISQEKCRIDLWVRDKDFAVIFENKVYDACDQETQIARYIECTQRYRYPLEKIFVVYMPQSDYKDPLDESWGKYKEDFAMRYARFSFRNGVLPWLKTAVLPSIPDKDKFLKSAIEQYVDYLEGIFKQRKSEKILNTMVEDYIKEQLGLNGHPKEYYSQLISKCKEIREVLEYLENERDDAERRCWHHWHDCLRSRYGKVDNCRIVFEYKPRSPQVGVKVNIAGRDVYLIIEREDRLYYGVKDCDEEIDENIENEMAPVLARFTQTREGPWYQWDYVESDSAYEQLVKLIDDTLEHIK